MLTLQIGQCGNQLGYHFYSLINQDITAGSPDDDYIQSSNSKWFQTSDKSEVQFAKVILVDAEEKVANNVIRNNSNDKWRYQKRNIVTPGDGGGSGNNWTFGYFERGPEFEESIMEAVRNELERTERLDGVLCLLSCAGGTGSGLGSYTIKTLRQEYPTKSITGVLVFPFVSGEVVTQNYNIIFSLTQIAEHADMIICLENEKLQKELNRTLSGISKSHHVNFFDDINSIACQKLTSIFQPASNDTKCNKMNALISKLIPHPLYKLTTIETNGINLNFNHFTTLSWQSQYKYFTKNLFNYYNYSNAAKIANNTSKSLANVLITRGSTECKRKNYHGPDNTDFNNYRDLNKDDIYGQVRWMSSEERFNHFHQSRPLFNYEKLATMITNNSQVHKPLGDIVNKAWTTYTHGAYLHQYKKYGLEDDDFLKAFAKVESYVASYKSLEH